MIRATSIHSRPPTPFTLVGWVSAFPVVAVLWRELRKGFFDSYRPELHYMRGPGPKWRERHGAPDANRRSAAVKTY